MNHHPQSSEELRALVREFFDTEAGHFPEAGSEPASRWQQAVTAIFRQSVRLRFQRVFQQIGPLDGCRVLDIGCGSGTYSVEAVRAGASHVTGIDLSTKMIQLATDRATTSGVRDRCNFKAMDFMDNPPEGKFDFIIAMGVMDYVSDPAAFLARVTERFTKKAFLSFPKSGGILAWQRRWRYRKRCPLYLYSQPEIVKLLTEFPGMGWMIEPVARDWFVTLHHGGD